jgi:hypothetical protein
MKMRRKPTATECEDGGEEYLEISKRTMKLKERGNWNENPLNNEWKTKIEMEIEQTLENAERDPLGFVLERK